MKLKRTPKADIDAKVKEVANILGITQYLDRKPKALSGGQRQRVAIGRAMVRNPKVFLMDEPLSNLDAKLRNEMRAEIIKLRQRIDTTFMYVTHDQTEAMTLADRIVIMKDGYVNQIGTPQELFNSPVNLFVAGFIGMPVMNFFKGSKLLLRGRQVFCRDPRREVRAQRLPAEGAQVEGRKAHQHRCGRSSAAHHRRQRQAQREDRSQRDDGHRVQHPCAQR